MAKLLLLSGPNLDKLGKREPAIYGNLTLDQLVNIAQDQAKKLGLDLEHFQSDSEAQLIQKIWEAPENFDVIIINAGALTHYSWTLADALKGCGKPVIELHLTNPISRESFRHNSVISYASTKVIAGFGMLGYKLAVIAAAEILR